MNGTLLKSCALFATLLVATSPAFAKKKPVDISVLKGNYSGTFTLASGTTSLGGPSAVRLITAKNGKTATLDYQATVTNEGATLPLSTSIILKTNGTSSVSNAVLGLSGLTLPATGTAHFGKNNFTFSTSGNYMGTSYALSGTGTVKEAGKKRHLTLNLTLTISTSVITVNNVLTAKAPKK